MTFEVTILGNGSATPTLQHNPSAQVVNLHDKLFLVDCGEGTQLQMRRYEVKFQRINHIFISHLHGDHYLGLSGYISTMSLLGRQRDLHLYCPADLRQLVELNLKLSESYLDFKLFFHPLDFKESQLLFEDRTLEIHSFPLKHRIDCCGFLFKEKARVPKLKKGVVDEYELEPGQILKLKKGQDVELRDGSLLRAAQLLDEPDELRSYAYCSDTMYWESLLPHIRHSNLLYHESTFLSVDIERAKATFHSTAAQAGQIASKAGVKQLLLGHFSSRYRTLEPFTEEAKQFFRNTSISVEGVTYPVQ